jgi:hypothetical protein
MDKQTIIIALVVGLLVLIGMLWFVWKIYYRLFKHLVIALLIGAAGAMLMYYRYSSSSAPRDPNIGKHAYGNHTGRYLGVVEGQGNDKTRGPVWVIRQPGGYQMSYPKSRVTLKDKMETVPQTGNSDLASPLPASTNNNPQKKN